MPKKLPQAVTRKIRRITRDIVSLERIMYGSHDQEDQVLCAGMLEHRRDDVVRGAVLQMHTAIENVLTEMIEDRLLSVPPGNQKRRDKAARSAAGKALYSFLEGDQRLRPLNFFGKLSLARGLGLITPSLQKKLAELNSLRNKCSHHWLLYVRPRRNKKRSAKKPHLLAYKGHSLHDPEVFEDFFSDFGELYLRLYALQTGTRL